MAREPDLALGPAESTTTAPARGIGGRARAWWRRFAAAVSWTPPTSTEVGTVLKSGLAAGLAWWLARMVTDIPNPALAPLTALVVVQVSVRASVRSAFERTGAVLLGVLAALAIGDALALDGVTVAVLVAVSLGVAELLLRLPRAAANQVPVSVLVVLSAVASNPESEGWRRAIDTLIGAAVGVVVSLVLPASRRVDARQALERLGRRLGEVLEAMGGGLVERWSAEQTEAWRRTARTVRERLVANTEEAVGNGREAARWNVRDRRHIEELGRYEEVLPRLERTAIGVSVISRGLDDHARLSGGPHDPMPAMGQLLDALAGAVRALVDSVLAGADGTALDAALALVMERRDRCARGASDRARVALEHDADDADDALRLEVEWLGYAALLVQVDRIVGDLSAPLPA
jgi:uncharacterized membrane protein YccC